MSAWQNNAACKGCDPDLWHAEGRGAFNARRVCTTCPVRRPCLDYALTNRIDHGVWGGLSAAERARLLRRRHQVA